MTMKMKTLTKLALTFAGVAIVRKAFDTSIHIRKYQMKSKKIKNNVRVMFLSDLHNNQFGDNQSILIEQISEQKPDVVLLGGDLYDYVGNVHPTTNLLDWLGQHYPTFYVTGNHELRMKHLVGFKRLIREMNIQVLEGDRAKVEVGQTTLVINGVDDAKHKRTFKKQLKHLGKKLDTEYFNVLISHRPEQVEQYEKYPFDLILAGHAHGGQFRIPGLINGLYSPQQGFFPAYAGGEYELDNEATMIVSRGLMIQNQQFPRIFNPPEIVIVDLHK